MRYILRTIDSGWKTINWRIYIEKISPHPALITVRIHKWDTQKLRRRKKEPP